MFPTARFAKFWEIFCIYRNTVFILIFNAFGFILLIWIPQEIIFLTVWGVIDTPLFKSFYYHFRFYIFYQKSGFIFCIKNYCSICFSFGDFFTRVFLFFCALVREYIYTLKISVIHHFLVKAHIHKQSQICLIQGKNGIHLFGNMSISLT